MTAPATAKQLVDELWSYCHVLRHDGVSTGDLELRLRNHDDLARAEPLILASYEAG